MKRTGQRDQGDRLQLGGRGTDQSLSYSRTSSLLLLLLSLILVVQPVVKVDDDLARTESFGYLLVSAVLVDVTPSNINNSELANGADSDVLMKNLEESKGGVTDHWPGR